MTATLCACCNEAVIGMDCSTRAGGQEAPGDASRQLHKVLLQSQQLAKGLEALGDH